MWPKSGEHRASEQRPRARRASSAALVFVCAAAVSGGLAHADDVEDQKKEADRRAAQLSASLEGTSKELGTAYSNLQATKAKIPGAQQQLASAQAALKGAEARQQAAQSKADSLAQKLAVAKASESRTAEELSKANSALDGQQKALDVYAASVYQGGDSSSTLSFALGATSASDLVEKMTLADTASTLANDKITSLSNSKADTASKQAYLKAVRKEISDLKGEADSALTAAKSATTAAAQARTRAETAKKELDGLLATQSKQTSELEKRKKSQQGQLASTQAESARLGGILAERARIAREREAARQRALAAARARALKAKRAAEAKRIADEQARLARESRSAAAAKRAGRSVASSSGGSPLSNKVANAPAAPLAPSGGGFLSYAANGPLTSGFGMRFHPVLQRWMLHDGLDFGIACGTPVYASANGTVVHAGYTPNGWGNQVLIDHGMQRGVDLVTSYNHLSSIVVGNGPVTRGQLIAYSGTTGYSTGCHLHFGTYEDGVPVDPWNWLR